MNRYGTSHFVSRKAAIESYRTYFGPTPSVTEVAREVDRKIGEGEIAIGRPRGIKGWDVVVIDGRYHQQQRPAKCGTPADDIPF